MEGNEQDPVADLSARRAAVQADPVLRFYQRHGHPAGRGAQLAVSDTGSDEDEDPGTA